MGNLMGWIKSNLLVVVFTSLALLMLPAAYVGSGMWNKKIQDKANAEFQETKRGMDSASKVTYQLQAVFAGEETISESRAPNAAVTAFYKQKRADRSRQVSAVMDSAVARNRGNHTVLLPELLPNQPDTRRRERLTEDFAVMLLGRENQASVYKRLLDQANAGDPMEAEEVAALVGDYDQQERDQRIASGTSVDLSPDQAEALSKRLSQRRLAVIAQRANDISVYADVIAITKAMSDVSVSQSPVRGVPKVESEDLFRWQWDYWVVADILGAVSIANSDATGPTGVPDSVVKRITRISIEKPDLSGNTASSADEDEDDDDDWSGGGSSDYGDGGLWGATHTGRHSETPEGMDIRMVRLEVVVSTERLPRLFQALGEQNFMTVTSIKLNDMDGWSDLESGYYYGNEHVAHAVIDIETVWLREWTQDSMPDELRETLGIPREDETDGEDEG